MEKSIKNWFEGFEKGILHLDQQEREVLFCECAKNCVENGILLVYQNFYNEADGSIDIFFEKLNNIDGIHTEIFEAGKKFNLFFEKCTCNLHTEGYVDSPLLCECSRQSVIYVLNLFWSNKKFDVKICSTILRGGENCELRITAY